MDQLSPLQKQISNRNCLSPIGFKFSLAKEPKVDFFSNSASIPGINLGVAIQPSYLKDIPIPGDKLTYNDFSLRFMIDEDMENYLLVHNWLRGFGYPESVYEYQELLNDDKYSPGRQTAMSGQSDGTLFIYNSNYQPTASVIFKGMFPTSLTPIEFNAKESGVNYIEAEVVFKYTIYDIIKY